MFKETVEFIRNVYDTEEFIPLHAPYFDEREKETDGMKLTIDGLKVEIPEKLIKERIELIGISRDEVQEKLEKDARIYKECLLFNKKYNPENFEQKFVAYLDSEIAIYRA